MLRQYASQIQPELAMACLCLKDTGLVSQFLPPRVQPFYRATRGGFLF